MKNGDICFQINVCLQIMKFHRLIALLFVLSISAPVLLSGKARITAWVKDEMTKQPLDSATVYLLKDGIVIDSVFNELAYIEMPQMNGRSFHLSHSIFIPDKGEYEVRATAPGYRLKSFFVSVTDIEKEADDQVLGELFFYLDNAENTDVPRKLPQEMISVKAIHETVSLNMAEDAGLFNLIEQFQDISLDENNRIFWEGNLVESICVNGKDIGKDNLSDSVRKIPAGVVDKVMFYQREWREGFRRNADDIKAGPLVMNVILKKGAEDYSLVEDKGKNGTIWCFFGAGVLLTVLIAGHIYRKHTHREPDIPEDNHSEPEGNVGGTDEIAFRESFVKRNINGATEKELAELVDFVRKMDPEFHRSVSAMNLKERDFYDALLIRLGVGLSECGNILRCSASTLGMKRLRMIRSLQDNRGFNRWDCYILSFSSKSKNH